MVLNVLISALGVNLMNKKILFAILASCVSVAQTHNPHASKIDATIAYAKNTANKVTEKAEELLDEAEETVKKEIKPKNRFQRMASSIGKNKALAAAILIAAFITYHDVVNPRLEKLPWWTNSAKEGFKIMTVAAFGDYLKDGFKDGWNEVIFGEKSEKKSK